MREKQPRQLPVLMYHDVSLKRTDGLTVQEEELDNQLSWLKDQGYETITFTVLKEAFEHDKRLPAKPILLTFDDAYASFASRVLPLLEKHDMHAALMVPVAFIGKTNMWDQGEEPILSDEQIRQLYNSGRVEIGLHSFLHHNYKEMAPEDMREDLEQCFQTLSHHHIHYIPVLAYPYGGFPRKDKELNQQMKSLFREMGLWFALRIGNRINSLPLRDMYEVKRIDIRGTDSFSVFKRKVRHGRKHPFV